MCNNNNHNKHHNDDDEHLQHHISLRKRTRQTDDHHHNNEDDDGHDDVHQVKRSKTVFSSPKRNIDLNATDNDEEEEETETEEEYNQQLETSTTTDEDEEDERFEDGQGVEKSKLDESYPPILTTSALSKSVLGSIQSAKIDPRAVIVWESAPFLIRQDILQVTKHPDAVGGKFLKLFKQENEGKEPFILVTKEHLPELKKQQPKLNGHHFSFKGGNTVHALKLFTLDYVLWLQNYLKSH